MPKRDTKKKGYSRERGANMDVVKGVSEAAYNLIDNALASRHLLIHGTKDNKTIRDTSGEVYGSPLIDIRRHHGSNTYDFIANYSEHGDPKEKQDIMKTVREKVDQAKNLSEKDKK